MAPRLNTVFEWCNDLSEMRRFYTDALGMEAAKILNSSQSRVAKMEAADPTVSVDLLVRAFLALGASRKELGRVIASRAAYVGLMKLSIKVVPASSGNCIVGWMGETLQPVRFETRIGC